ncbi:uncharacterized protein LOC119607481 [Lucilia sericata]|uniref:uncharacterized protein LOC119607481 n=1 Tax=Lucilia sericata TaxID=13632 RepID=UPI0018A858AD|nr:uncharacterized protein LOC119607481 [Lucilia sericata]
MPATEVLNHVEEQLTKCSSDVKSEDFCIEDSPEWLTREYLETCLRSYYHNQQLQLVKIHAKAALGKGENYGGVLTRVKAEFKPNCKSSNKKGSYIIKTSFEGDELAIKAMEPYDIFNREIKIYEEILPKLKLLLEEIGDEEQIFAETLAVDKEKSALIFEDLNDRDFIMPDRVQGLDMDTAKIVLRKLAKMHASSAVLNEREGKCLEGYDCGMFNRHTENYAPCFVGCLEACTRLVAKWPDYQHFSEKLAKLKPQFMELGKQVFDPLPSHLNVFCHGDLWTNNVLVKYDPKTKKPLDVIIIDFQYAAWGSPAIDLFYFMNTSLREEIHLNNQDELIQFYYHHLYDTLIKLKYHGDIPSLHKFHLQLEEKSFYAFHSTCVVQPIQRNVVNDDADFNALMQSDERAIRFKNTCYTNPYIQNIIKKLLPVYERRGLLDPDQ